MIPFLSIGRAMKLGRAAKDLSQEELATLVKISRQTIMSIENGETNPSFKLAWRISRTLNFRLDTVLPNNPDPVDADIYIDTDTLACVCALTGPDACSSCFPLGYKPAKLSKIPLISSLPFDHATR